MKKILLFVMTGAIAGFVATTARAQSSDALIDKLIEKGILSVKEANDLREDADKDFTKAYSAKSGMAEWVSALKFNGDFRGRYDGVFGDNDGGSFLGDRHRLRYRLRFGATANLSDHFEVGLRLGSGEVNSASPSFGGNVFSANTTLNNDASRKFIFIDLAYARWTPKDWLDFQIGKMNGLFWMTDMVLDPDYNPEGAQEKITWNVVEDKHAITFTSGQWVIAENFVGSGKGINNDTYLFVNQVDWTAKWVKQFSTRAALGAYNFAHQQDISAALETFLNQNGSPASGAGGKNFNPVIARAEATYALESFPRFNGEFPITVGAEYVNNPAAKHFNEGYNVGITFGSNKHKGNWQLSYNFKNIESASTWHGLNDDDFGFGAKGGTDVRGHQVVASYHMYEPFFINIRYMNTEQINNAPKTPNNQDRIFVDLLWSF